MLVQDGQKVCEVGMLRPSGKARLPSRHSVVMEGLAQQRLVKALLWASEIAAEWTKTSRINFAGLFWRCFKEWRNLPGRSL